MKKLLAVLVTSAFMTGGASAVSVSWSSNAIQYGGSTLKNNTSVLAYVVYLSSGNFADSYTIDASFDASKIGTIVTSDTDGTTKAGKSSGTYSFTEGTKKNGDVFGLVLRYTDGTDVYWNLSATKNTLAGLVAGDPTFAPTEWSDFAVNGSNGTDPTLTAGGGWVKAVPEPATGALALAGVALLFRRRRA